ncbi:calcium-dependent protein serine/threonine phosphatase regulator [Malassezia pachydermatis]
MFANIPTAFFESEPLMDLFHTLLHSYGTLVSCSPLPAFGRCIAVYEKPEEAAYVKHALDRLLLPYEREEYGDLGEPVRVLTRDFSSAHKEGYVLRKLTVSAILRVYFDRPTPLVLLPSGEYVPARTLEASKPYLEPPAPEREFLISPPGSPPVGWEPRSEDRPNTDTLAEDLIEALQALSAAQATTDDTDVSEKTPTAPASNVPTMLIPSTAMTIPGVVLHESETMESMTAPRSSIHQVKATIESLHQPTARPPM